MAQTWRLCDGAGLGKSLWDAKGLLKPAGEWEEGITKAAGKSRHGEGDAASVSLGTENREGVRHPSGTSSPPPGARNATSAVTQNPAVTQHAAEMSPGAGACAPRPCS